MASTPYLSVIIPSYNEQANLSRGVLDQIWTYLKKQSYLFELLLTDDGSTDGTLEELRFFARGKKEVQVLDNPHRGKGPTVTVGMLAATGEWRLFTDFDQATPIFEVEKLLKMTHKQKLLIIIGSREITGSKRDREPIHRHVMGKVFNMLVQVLALPGIHDSQCGFKLFSAEATKLLFPRLAVYKPGVVVRPDAFTGAFDVELLFVARALGVPILEEPIHWQHIRTNRVSPIKDSWRMFVDVLRIRRASWTGQYTKS